MLALVLVLITPPVDADGLTELRLTWVRCSTPLILKFYQSVVYTVEVQFASPPPGPQLLRAPLHLECQESPPVATLTTVISYSCNPSYRTRVLTSALCVCWHSVTGLWLTIQCHVQNGSNYRLERGITRSRGKSQLVLHTAARRGGSGEAGLFGRPPSRRVTSS